MLVKNNIKANKKLLTIIPVPAATMKNDRSPSLTFWLKFRPTSCVSADSRLTSSPVLVVPNHAASCRIIAWYTFLRRACVMRWPGILIRIGFVSITKVVREDFNVLFIAVVVNLLKKMFNVTLFWCDFVIIVHISSILNIRCFALFFGAQSAKALGIAPKGFYICMSY